MNREETIYLGIKLYSQRATLMYLHTVRLMYVYFTMSQYTIRSSMDILVVAFCEISNSSAGGELIGMPTCAIARRPRPGTGCLILHCLKCTSCD